MFASNTKALTFLPKHTHSSETNEVARMARIDSKNELIYVALNRPSRIEAYSEIVYTEFNSPTPANDFASWAAGTDLPPNKMLITPGMPMDDPARRNQKQNAFVASI